MYIVDQLYLRPPQHPHLLPKPNYYPLSALCVQTSFLEIPFSVKLIETKPVSSITRMRAVSRLHIGICVGKGGTKVD